MIFRRRWPRASGPGCETARVRAACRQVLGDAFNRGQIGGAVIETKFSSYATHKVLTGFAVGECD